MERATGSSRTLFDLRIDENAENVEEMCTVPRLCRLRTLDKKS